MSTTPGVTPGLWRGVRYALVPALVLDGLVVAAVVQLVRWLG